jgi:hypothetical protein
MAPRQIFPHLWLRIAIQFQHCAELCHCLARQRDAPALSLMASAVAASAGPSGADFDGGRSSAHKPIAGRQMCRRSWSVNC